MEVILKPRDAPYQFSLRTLLVVMALAGLCFWMAVQLVLLPPGYVLLEDARLVAARMTEQEVIKILGEPLRKSATAPDTDVWTYQLAYATGHRKHFVVVFVDGEVRMRYMHW